MKPNSTEQISIPHAGWTEIFTMVPFTSRTRSILALMAGIAVLIFCPAAAFTANSLDITVDESGDATAIFQFTLEGFLENAIPQSILEQELLKGLGTSSEPPELITMDRSSATIRLKQFASLFDVPTGTEYRTVSMDFTKAEVALQQSAVNSIVSADFSPAVMTVTFPDDYISRFTNADLLPSLTHTIIDPVKAASVVHTPSTNGAVKVVSIPEGARVDIDGNYAGTAPATFTGIPAGSHTLRFSMENYEGVEKTVSVKEGQTIQISVFLAYVQPTPQQAPGFAGVLVLAGIALLLVVMAVRRRM